MPWVVDHVAQTRRSEVLNLLAMAHAISSPLTDKCADMHHESHSMVGGSQMGDLISTSFSAAAVRFGEATLIIEQAIHDARAIDIMKWEPEDDNHNP